MAKHILIVDHDFDVRMSIFEAVKQSTAYQCLLASDGMEALGVVLRQQFDLFVIDLHLSDIRAWDLIGNLRESTRHHATPIIAMSGEEDTSIQQTALEAGCDRCLIKPINMDHLVMIITHLLDPVSTVF